MFVAHKSVPAQGLPNDFDFRAGYGTSAWMTSMTLEFPGNMPLYSDAWLARRHATVVAL
jgi:hypothetical protein